MWRAALFFLRLTCHALAVPSQSKRREILDAFVRWTDDWRDTTFSNALYAIGGGHVHTIAMRSVSGIMFYWARAVTATRTRIRFAPPAPACPTHLPHTPHTPTAPPPTACAAYAACAASAARAARAASTSPDAATATTRRCHPTPTPPRSS